MWTIAKAGVEILKNNGPKIVETIRTTGPKFFTGSVLAYEVYSYNRRALLELEVLKREKAEKHADTQKRLAVDQQLADNDTVRANTDKGKLEWDKERYFLENPDKRRDSSNTPLQNETPKNSSSSGSSLYDYFFAKSPFEELTSLNDLPYLLDMSTHILMQNVGYMIICISKIGLICGLYLWINLLLRVFGDKYSGKLPERVRRALTLYKNTQY